MFSREGVTDTTAVVDDIEETNEETIEVVDTVIDEVTNILDDGGKGTEVSEEEEIVMVLSGRGREERTEEVEMVGMLVEGGDSARSRAEGEGFGEEEPLVDIGGSKACILGGGMEVSSSQVTVLSRSLALFALRKDIQDEHFQSFG